MPRNIAAITFLTAALICAASSSVSADANRIIIHVMPEIYDAEILVRYVLPSASEKTWISVPRSVGSVEQSHYLTEEEREILESMGVDTSAIPQAMVDALGESGLSGDRIELVDAPDHATKHVLLTPHGEAVDFTATIAVRKVRQGRQRIIRIPIEASFPVHSVIVQVPAVRRMRDFTITPDDSLRVFKRDEVDHWQIEVNPKTTRVVTISYTNPDPFPFDTPSSRWGGGLTLGVYTTSYDDVEEAFNESLSPGMFLEAFITRQWSWNALELAAGAGARSGEFDELDIPDHTLDTFEMRVALWYRRHLPPLGFLGGLWVMGGAGYDWASVDIAPALGSDLPSSEQFDDPVAKARGPTVSVGVLWMSEFRYKESTPYSESGRGTMGLEYRYTWSNLTTTVTNDRWVPADTRLGITGHTIAVRFGGLLGSGKLVTGL